MELIHRRILIFALIVALLVSQFSAQSPTSPARPLDGLLQRYAYRAFVRPRTGVFYDGHVPSNLSGIQISVVRLRSGSLRSHGVKRYKEFAIPTGCIVQPYVRRLALVYHNLANLSQAFYPLPGFTYLAPVIGLLVYNASDLTAAAALPELGFAVPMSPISIHFADLRPVPAAGLSPKCVWFNLEGLPEFHDLAPGNVCVTFQQGHFSVVVNYTEPAPAAPSAGRKNGTRVWKVVVGVVGGVVALALAALLVGCARRYRRDRKVAEMERHAVVGEALRVAQVGHTKMPVALGTRTLPVIENEYVA